MRLIATCPDEAKPALIAELEALGATELAPTFRANVSRPDVAVPVATTAMRSSPEGICDR